MDDMLPEMMKFIGSAMPERVTRLERLVCAILSKVSTQITSENFTETASGIVTFAQQIDLLIGMSGQVLPPSGSMVYTAPEALEGHILDALNRMYKEGKYDSTFATEYFSKELVSSMMALLNERRESKKNEELN